MMTPDRTMTPLDPLEFKGLLERAQRLCAETRYLRKATQDLVFDTQDTMEACAYAMRKPR